jgi:hypothetical protein
MNSCDVLNAFGGSDLESQVYGVVSLASRLAANVKNRTNRFRIAYWLFDFNKKLGTFLKNAHDIMEGRVLVSPAVEPVTPQSLETNIENMEYLYRVIDYVWSRASRKTNE